MATTLPSPVRSASRRRPDLLFAALSLGAGLCLGLTVVVDWGLGVAALLAAVVLPAAVIRPAWIPYGLVATLFAGVVDIGGITVARLAAPVALVATLSGLARGRARWDDPRPVLVPVAGYAALAVASLIWTISDAGTLDGIGALAVSLAYAGAFAVLVHDRSQLRPLSWVWTVSAVILAMVWIAGYATGVDRRFNIAGDPNFAATLLALSIPVVLAVASTGRTLAVRAAAFASVAVLAGGVVATLSRGGIITLALVGLVVLLVPAGLLFRSSSQKLAFATACLLGLGLLLPTAWGQLQDRFDGTIAQQDLGGRGDLWLAATRAFGQHPFTGIGYGAFHATSFQLLRETPGVHLTPHLRFRDGGEYVHSAYLGTLAELGVFGLAFFAAVIAATARALVTTARRARAAADPLVRSVAGALAVALLAYAVSALLLSSETDRTLWVIVGLSLCLRGLVRRPDQAAPAGQGAPTVDRYGMRRAVLPAQGP